MSTPIEVLKEAAKSFHAAGVFGDPGKIKLASVETLALLADAEGQPPGAAVRDYSLVSGRPAKKADAMLRSFISAGGKVEWHEMTDKLADATFSHPAGGTARIAWDHRRVSEAGISNPLYKKFPRAMLRARTISEGCRAIYPAATSGIYTPEEAVDIPEVEVPKKEEKQSDVAVALLETAKETAAKGSAALQHFWTKELTKAQRQSIAYHLDALKEDALAADGASIKEGD